MACHAMPCQANHLDGWMDICSSVCQIKQTSLIVSDKYANTAAAAVATASALNERRKEEMDDDELEEDKLSSSSLVVVHLLLYFWRKINNTRLY